MDTIITVDAEGYASINTDPEVTAHGDTLYSALLALLIQLRGDNITTDDEDADLMEANRRAHARRAAKVAA